MKQDKYSKIDKEIEYMRCSFFEGLQSEGDSICGTCAHFESIFNKNGSISDLGQCFKPCPVKRGLDKVHAESSAKSYINSGIANNYSKLVRNNNNE